MGHKIRSFRYIPSRVFEIHRETWKEQLRVCVVVYKHYLLVVDIVVMGLVLGQSLIVISTTGILLFAKVCPLYNVLWECIFVVYTLTTLFKNTLTDHYTSGHQTLLVCKICIYLLWFLRYWDSN